MQLTRRAMKFFLKSKRAKGGDGRISGLFYGPLSASHHSGGFTPVPCRFAMSSTKVTAFSGQAWAFSVKIRLKTWKSAKLPWFFKSSYASPTTPWALTESRHRPWQDLKPKPPFYLTACATSPKFPARPLWQPPLLAARPCPVSCAASIVRAPWWVPAKFLVKPRPYARLLARRWMKRSVTLLPANSNLRNSRVAGCTPGVL